RHREDKERLIEQFLSAMAWTRGSNIEQRADNPVMVDAPPRLSDAARQLLLSYDWPGNLRELKFVLQRALLHADPQWLIDVEDIYLPFKDNDDCNFALRGTTADEAPERLPNATSESI